MALAGLIAAALVGCGGSDDETTSTTVSTTETTTQTAPALTPAESLEKAAVDWARKFGAGEKGACVYMQASCEDLYLSGSPSAFVASFADAKIDCFTFQDSSSGEPKGQALVLYSNGEVVAWTRVGEAWSVSNLGGDLGKDFECPST